MGQFDGMTDADLMALLDEKQRKYDEVQEKLAGLEGKDRQMWSNLLRGIDQAIVRIQKHLEHKNRRR